MATAEQPPRDALTPAAVDLFDDTPGQQLTDQQFAQAVRALGGTRMALIGDANSDLLPDGQLRDQWLDLRQAWERLDALVADMDRHLAEVAAQPPAPEQPEWWGSYRELCEAIDQHIGLEAAAPVRRQEYRPDLERWHRAVIRRHVRDGRPAWRLNVSWDQLATTAAPYLDHSGE